MKTHVHLHDRRSSARKGFTLTELLVAIVIIIALAVVVVTATRNARMGATKVADMNNLRSLATAAMAAGSDNAGRLPFIHASNPAPYYLKDRNTLESYGIFKEQCYIPRKDVEGGPPNYSFWKMFGNQTPTHYCYFAKDNPSGASWFEGGSVVPPERSEYRGNIPYDTIIQDKTRAFARNTTDDAWYPVLWAGISRDWPGKKHLAAVMQNDQALGVNVMYLDGSSQ